jgi:GTPase SAR1 family protein
MPSIPPVLVPDDCPLLKRKPDTLRSVLEDYAAAIAAAESLRSRFPANFDQPDVRASLESLESIRERLTRTHFKVGFLGPFQCGKSTTLNNLLGKKIAGTGAGKATTSVITRLIVGLPGQLEKLRLRYFTVDEYIARRETLCNWVGLQNIAGLSEAKVLELLKSHSVHRGVSANRPVLPDDVPYLKAFLGSYEAGASKKLVGAASVIRDVPYAEKDKYLTHTHDDSGRIPASQNLLISEATIHFPTERFDPELEMVDCPGLGSGRSVDDLLTEEYIPQLDGALLFLRADSMYSAQVFSILNKLKETFRDDLRSRVWVIVNKMDTPAREAKLDGDAQGMTTFDLIAQLESQHGIPLSQVCLGCNDIFILPRTGAGEVERTRALNALKLEVADEPALKAKIDPALHEAFEEMLRDGSISRLQKLMKERIAPSVADGILKDTALGAKRAARDLKDALTQAEQPASQQERKDARTWDNALHELHYELLAAQNTGRGGLYAQLEGLGTKARTNLEVEFDRLLPRDEVFAEMDAQHVLARFESDAESLQMVADQEFARIAHAVFTEIAGLLKARGLPGITLPCGRDPLAVWDDGVREDRDIVGWGGKLRPTLYDPVLHGLLREDGLTRNFGGTQFKKLLRDKLRASVHQMALAVRFRVRFRLTDLQRQIGSRGGPVPIRPVSE